MIFVTNYFLPLDQRRREELERCLDENQKNDWFRTLLIFCREGNFGPRIVLEKIDRPSFSEMLMRACEIALPDEVIVLANADITFDQTLAFAGKVPMKELWALTRWENGRHYGRTYSQDVWIMRNRGIPMCGKFPMGVPGCDNRIAQLFHEQGWCVKNPSYSIRAHHHHVSNVRTYTQKDRVKGRYLYIRPSRLECDDAANVCLESRSGTESLAQSEVTDV